MGKKSELTKYDLYQILSAKAEVGHYLPPAGLFKEVEDMLEFLDNYKKVILRPLESSSGRGICVLEQKEEGYKLTDCRKKEQVTLNLSGIEELKNFFKSTENDLNKYIIQKLIKSARIEQSIFDMRVVMKKGVHDDWKCGELEYAAGRNKFLFTNASREAYPAPLSEAVQRAYPLKFDFMKTINQVRKICSKTCEAINTTLEYEDGVEFEVAIDENNKPWLIEVNLIECMKKFKVIDYNTYTPVKGIPLLYSTTLYEFANK